MEVVRPDGSEVREWVRPTGKKLLCLVLLTSGRSIRRDEAAAALFPSAGTGAPNALAKAIHWCRAALGEPLGRQLVSDVGHLRWSGAAHVDADVCLVLARGSCPPLTLDELRTVGLDERPLLPGWDEDWVDALRQQIEVGRRCAVARLAIELEGADESLDEATHLWGRLVDADPLDERHQQGLLRSLLAANHPREARTAYVRYRQVLWTDLGTVPSTGLETWWRRAAVPEGLDGLGSAAAVPITPTPSPDLGQSGLVGRDTELGQLNELLEGTEQGRGGSATLVGPAGCGKSELLQATMDRWRRRGWFVAHAAGPTGGGPPHRVAMNLFRGLLGSSDAVKLERLLGSSPGGATQPTHQDRAGGAFHAQVADLVDRAASIPVLLVVDDLHDVDPASARLLRFLAHRGQPRRWSLLAATRSPESALPGSHLISVGPLATSVVRAILNERFATQDRTQLALAAQRAQGNPLYALEIAAMLAASPSATPIPPSATELLRHRLGQLPPAQRLLMPLIVVAGEEATWPLVARAVALGVAKDGLSHQEALTALELLRRADLLRERDAHFTPSHPLVGEASLALLPRTKHAVLHDAVAQALEEMGATPASVAHHRVSAFDLVPDGRRAATAAAAAHEAARVALAQGRNSDAASMARCVERAWASSDLEGRRGLDAARSDAHLILGHALAVASPSQAQAAYENGRRAATDDDTRARFLIAQGWLQYMHGDLARAAQTYQQGLCLEGARSTTTAALLTHLGWTLARQGLYDRGLALCEQALELLDETRDPLVLGTALDRKGMILAFLGSNREALVTADLALEVASSAGDLSLLSAVQAHRGSISGRLGEWESALRYLDEAVVLARSAGDAYVESVAWWARTDVLTRKGDTVGALEANLEEERVLRITGNAVHLAACQRRRRRLTGLDDAVAVDTHGRTP